MMNGVGALLDRRATVYAACAACAAIGLFFIFVWTPLPWGWKGIDGYDAIALAMAHGAPFPTVHLVWGYAYFLTFFYWLFGNHPAVPLTVQALLNATIPLMLYRLVRADFSERIAVMAAVLVGLFSFNTIYASTQASDSVCTVLVVAAMLALQQGDARRKTRYFALAGLLCAIAYQFRPNLVLYPFFLSAAYLVFRRGVSGRFGRIAVLLVVFVAGGAPWVIRNYRWTGLFIPASTHGGVQLWFGTLQTGPYRESWLYNPRAAFEAPPVDYTSVDELPPIVTTTALRCDDDRPRTFELVYWTNRDQTPRRLTATPDANLAVTVMLPLQPSPTAIYYYVETTSTERGRTVHVTTPAAGSSDPLMTVVSRDHLGDLDVDNHALDVFDVVRMLQHHAWAEPLANPAQDDLDGDGRVTDADIRRAAALIADEGADPVQVRDPGASVASDAGAATLHFRDGSSLGVPRHWSGKITDLQLVTPVVDSSAARLVSRSRSFANVSSRGAVKTAPADACLTTGAIRLNGVPYRRLPHELRRFTALSLDNIRHDPWAYLTASAARAVRVFVIAGSEDVRTAYQFSSAGRVYAIGRIASIAFLALFAAGVWIAYRRGYRLLMLLTPIVYVPLTIAFMLINARYSMTVQPFLFAFVAVPIVTAIDRMSRRGDPSVVQSH